MRKDVLLFVSLCEMLRVLLGDLEVVIELPIGGESA